MAFYEGSIEASGFINTLKDNMVSEGWVVVTSPGAPGDVYWLRGSGNYLFAYLNDNGLEFIQGIANDAVGDGSAGYTVVGLISDNRKFNVDSTTAMIPYAFSVDNEGVRGYFGRNGYQQPIYIGRVETDSTASKDYASVLLNRDGKIQALRETLEDDEYGKFELKMFGLEQAGSSMIQPSAISNDKIYYFYSSVYVVSPLSGVIGKLKNIYRMPNLGIRFNEFSQDGSDYKVVFSRHNVQVAKFITEGWQSPNMDMVVLQS